MSVEPRATLQRLGIRLMERARRTDALALLPDLEASQWWEPARLETQQALRLRELLAFCRTEVPWYRDLFARVNLDVTAGGTTDALARLPVLTKEAIRAAGASFHSTRFAQLQPRAKSTSGSTGVPLNYHLDRTSHSYLWAQIWRAWSQTGYRPGDRYATLSGGSLLPEKVGIKQRAYLALSGALHLPSYHLTEPIMDRYATLLTRRRVAFLYGYPSSVELFARFCLADRRRAGDLRAVLTTSEQLAPRARAAIAEAFGCPVIDTYGCNDGGLYSFECAEAAGFHYGMESVCVEIVDEAGRVLPDGEVGRIVTTHITNLAEPFLRYVTGDMGALDRSPCRCGRGLARIVKLQGRERDFVLTPDGRKVHGAFFNHFAPFYDSPWIERFQIHQPKSGQITVRLRIGREPTAAERERVITELRRGLGEMDIRIEFVTEMPLTATGKFRVIVSDIAEQA